MENRADSVLVALVTGAAFFVLIAGLLLAAVGAILLVTSQNHIDESYSSILIGMGLCLSAPGAAGFGLGRYVLARMENSDR